MQRNFWTTYVFCSTQGLDAAWKSEYSALCHGLVWLVIFTSRKSLEFQFSKSRRQMSTFNLIISASSVIYSVIRLLTSFLSPQGVALWFLPKHFRMRIWQLWAQLTHDLSLWSSCASGMLTDAHWIKLRVCFPIWRKVGLYRGGWVQAMQISWPSGKIWEVSLELLSYKRQKMTLKARSPSLLTGYASWDIKFLIWSHSRSFCSFFYPETLLSIWLKRGFRADSVSMSVFCLSYLPCLPLPQNI